MEKRGSLRGGVKARVDLVRIDSCSFWGGGVPGAVALWRRARPMGDFDAALQGAREHGVLPLSHLGLTQVPPAALGLRGLLRLDLGHNRLRALPPLGALAALRELFLNDNPLAALPGEAREGCLALRCLDVRRTRLRALPPALSRLPALLDVATAGAPLEAEAAAAGRAGGTPALLALLRRRDEREGLLAALRKTLALSVWKEAADSEGGRALLDALVAQCAAEFPGNAELKSINSNAVRLFATPLPEASAGAARARFEALRDDNERKALGAELELAMRALYFDAADPRLVARLRAELVGALPTLDDMRFLLAHARALLPGAAALIVPEQLPARIGALRARLGAEREAALAALAKALGAHYGEREPRDVEALARACASLLPRSEDLRSLGADVGELFPAEFASASARRAVRAFRAAQEDKGLGGAGGGAGGSRRRGGSG